MKGNFGIDALALRTCLCIVQVAFAMTALLHPAGPANAHDSMALAAGPECAPDEGPSAAPPGRCGADANKSPLPAASVSTPAVAASIEATFEYPVEIRGYWMPKDLECADPDEVFSDVMILIGATVVGRYEDVDTLRSVNLISSRPKAWLVESSLSIGGDDPDSSSNVFVLAGEQLAIVGEGYSDVYRKCR